MINRNLLTLIVLILILSLLAGCRIVDQSRVHDSGSDNIPWNTRAGWEDSIIGVPY